MNIALQIDDGPSILFLPNTYLNQETVPPSINHSVEACVDYFKVAETMPSYYENIKTWPQTTSLLCWNCTSRISCRPWFAATGSANLEIGKRKIINTEGLFCSVPCAGRWISIFSQNTWIANECLRKTYNEWTGNILREIPIALDPCIMKKFAGSAGISEIKYHKSNYKILQNCTIKTK